MRPDKATEAIAILEELVQEDIMTEQEFQAKKRDILNLVQQPANNRKSLTDEDAGTSKSLGGTPQSTSPISGSGYSSLNNSSSSLGQLGTITGGSLQSSPAQSPSTIHTRRASEPSTTGSSQPTITNNRVSTSLSSFHIKEAYTSDSSKDFITKLSAAVDFDFSKYPQFANIDKEYESEEKVIEFIGVLSEYDKVPPVISYILKAEVTRKENKNGLLREESLGSSLLRNFWFHFEGPNYLKTVISPLVKEVHSITKNKALEIDQYKVTEEAANKNLQKLLTLTKSFLGTFCHSQKFFPYTFRVVLKNFYEILTESEGMSTAHLGLGYSEDALRLFGGFLLLRFICPAIVTPKRFGLIKSEIGPNSQRALVLISKILQSIASQVEFEGEKEPYMVPANGFVKDNMPPMMAFFHDLADGEPPKPDPKKKEKLDKSKDKNKKTGTPGSPLATSPTKN